MVGYGLTCGSVTANTMPGHGITFGSVTGELMGCNGSIWVNL